MYKIVESLIRY